MKSIENINVLTSEIKELKNGIKQNNKQLKEFDSCFDQINKI